MNCLQCLVYGECQITKNATQYGYPGYGVSYPIEVQPANRLHCPIIKMLEGKVT